MKFWTKEQFEQFISVVDDPTYHALFTFMFYTGRRKGELFALYKKDVHANKIDIYKSLNRRHVGKGAWEISSTKADKTTTIPVCRIVQKEIASYKPCERGNFYFGGERPLASSSVDRAFQKYTEIAKLPRIRIHDLRHSFVSMLISLGANLFVIGDLISDTVEQVTRTYGHLIEEDKLKILDRI
jgi:integrase